MEIKRLAIGTLRQLGIEKAEISRFMQEATSGDHEHLIAVVESVFDVLEREEW